MINNNKPKKIYKVDGNDLNEWYAKHYVRPVR